MKFEDEGDPLKDFPVERKEPVSVRDPIISKIPATTKGTQEHKITSRAGDTYFTAAARKCMSPGQTDGQTSTKGS